MGIARAVEKRETRDVTRSMCEDPGAVSLVESPRRVLPTTTMASSARTTTVSSLTVERGVDDVAGAGRRPIRVVATFEGGALVLRPVGMPGITVSRRLDGDRPVWRYGPSIVVTLARA